MRAFEFQEKNMPLYSTSAFAPLPEVAIPAKPAYFFGSLPTDTDDTYARVTNVAISSNVAIVRATIYRGNVPPVGSLISIQGTSTSGGIFNVSAAPITTVSGDLATGDYSFTFALAHADISAIDDAGMAIVPIAETPETVADGISVAVYVPSNELRDYGTRSITVATTFPSLPTAATVTLYTAINNNADEYTSMGVVATVAAGAQTVGPLVTFTTPAGRFFRLVASDVSGGTNPTIIAKMVC